MPCTNLQNCDQCFQDCRQRGYSDLECVLSLCKPAGGWSGEVSRWCYATCREVGGSAAMCAAACNYRREPPPGPPPPGPPPPGGGCPGCGTGNECFYNCMMGNRGCAVCTALCCGSPPPPVPPGPGGGGGGGGGSGGEVNRAGQCGEGVKCSEGWSDPTCGLKKLIASFNCQVTAALEKIPSGDDIGAFSRQAAVIGAFGLGALVLLVLGLWVLIKDTPPAQAVRENAGKAAAAAVVVPGVPPL